MKGYTFIMLVLMEALCVTPLPGAIPKPECDECVSEDFTGFGTPASRCGCCPWPCCCKCVDISVPADPTVSVACKSLLDVMWINEAGMAAISPVDWIVNLQFIADVLEAVDIGETERVAMVTFAANATLEWCFDDPQTSTRESLNSAIFGLQQHEYFRNVVEAIEKALECLQQPTSRDQTPKLCLLAITGQVTHRLNELPGMAAKLNEACDKVVVVGVSAEVDFDQLKLLTAGDEDAILTVENLIGLHEFIYSIKKVVCETPDVIPEEKCFCCCTPEQFFGGGGAYYYNY